MPSVEDKEKTSIFIRSSAGISYPLFKARPNISTV